MPRLFTAEDASTDWLLQKTIAIIGYGNQGRAQALNLRDRGFSVVIGNARDASWEQAERDGLPVMAVKEATARADVVAVLIPDEVAPSVFADEIAPYLRADPVLVFASGYNVTYGFITPPAGADVVLVAPRMIGRGVRELAGKGEGFPVLVGVAQDASGEAWARALAFAKGIGALGRRGVAVESSFEEETFADLFGEQVIAGGQLYLIRAAFEVMVQAGISPEAALLELYASGEASEIFQAAASDGLWNQLRLHSRTSQYGQQTRGPRVVGDEVVKVLRSIMEEIQSGLFAREWMSEQQLGSPVLRRLWTQNVNHPMIRAESELYQRLGRRPI